jgi:hypothetical protein
MTRLLLVVVAITVLMTAIPVRAAPTASPNDLLHIHEVEITFHKAGSTKDLDLMLSLFTDDASLTSGGKTYTGRDQVRTYWINAGPFQPQNRWAGYTPAYKIRINVDGDRATLYFECLWVDVATSQIKAHTYSDDVLVRSGGKWLIKK